ncbi:MAG: penicillin-binding protein 2 [Acidobacteria bacterium]|nr:penicillin-binding protein 2 [Acidobacteriota bacterium]
MYGRNEKPSAFRLSAVQYAILGMFLFLAFGLWRLQVSQSDYYSAAAERNRIREVPILAPRGKILDRSGRTIVDNYPSFTALIMRDSSRDLDKDVNLIAAGLHIDTEEVRDKIRRFAWMPQYQPIYLKEDITPDETAFVEAHKSELPELSTIMAYRRLYPRKGFLAHLIGYVGEVSEDMLNQPQFELYNPGDVVGKSGVELQYNQLLMGTNGSRQVLVNSRGKEVGPPLDERPAVPGKQLKLTIDVDLQIAAEEAMEGKNGAIVAMDPHTGEILAMASRPAFNPNNFAIRIGRADWQKLVTDPSKPLLNKAIQAQLAPGSTFKIIMATAGWQEGIAQTLHVYCTGGGVFYGRRFGCWVKSGHGEVDLPKGIYQSCDVFFYTLAEKLGIDRIAKYATMFGFGQKSGIDLPDEASGVMPSEEWKLKNFRQKWFAGETISVGIGQGAVTVTPVQLTRAIAAVAMGGRLVIPHVVNPTDLPRGFVEVSRYTEVKNIPVDPNGWNVITDAMSRVLLPEGTAQSAHIPGIDIAGKTGSAQVVSLATRAKHRSDLFAQNGWFVGFTPRRNPDIIVCTLFEGGEHGKLAARIATQVIKAFVDKQRRQPTNVARSNSGSERVDVGALWTSGGEDGDADQLNGARFEMDLSGRRLPLATAAPGIN